MIPGFDARDIETSGARIRVRFGGAGPPLLMLHGYPQTSAMWRHVAPALAQRFTVVCPDLRGYGASSKPPAGEDYVNYSKREMARDQVEVMEALGHNRFGLVGHDRGARVAHRLAADWPDRVERLCVLDIAPTREMYRNTTEAFARAYWHWFFFILPPPRPERLIGADPATFLREFCGSRPAGLRIFDGALDEYVAAFRDPEAIRASCDDYRAAAGIDMAHDDADDAAGRKLEMPLLCLWGDQGIIGKCFDPLALWRQRARDVRGHALACSHYLAEELPEETTREIEGFFAG